MCVCRRDVRACAYAQRKWIEILKPTAATASCGKSSIPHIHTYTHTHTHTLRVRVPSVSTLMRMCRCVGLSVCLPASRPVCPLSFCPSACSQTSLSNEIINMTGTKGHTGPSAIVLEAPRVPLEAKPKSFTQKPQHAACLEQFWDWKRHRLLIEIELVVRGTKTS